MVAAVLLTGTHAAGSEETLFRVGFSSAMFTDVNKNDAKASVKVWGQSLARERGIPTDPDTRIFNDIDEIFRALRDKSVDAVGITILEYAALNRTVRFAPIFITHTGGRTREQYLVLVHRDSQIERLADLRGRSLTFHQNSRVRLAQPWLDTLLIQEVGKPAAEWVGKITQSPKLPKAVLPVFFHQSDAGVVTLTGFETMRELNPQIGQQLKILAKSPEVVPSVFCFRADYAPAFKENLFAGIRDLHKSVAGQQVLTVFQSEKIQDEPASCLDSALELLERHTQLTASTGLTNVQRSSGIPQLSGGANP
ncbi:MAG: phosphate/phosphite/phosphonate ABC transporter substrate-binding protein [Limisphaerales bacterium]